MTVPHTTGQPLWHGRFGEGPADELLAFTVSLPFDRRLATDDLVGSRAHVSMLAHVGLLTDEERSVIHAALDRVELELNEGTFAFAPTDEDIHTAIERRVTEIAGGTGAKLHTGRSRNDQVALDLRLYVRREGRDQIARIDALQQVLLRRANDTTDVALPGFTHLQRAQPVLLAHHLLAHFWALTTAGATVSRAPTCRHSARARSPVRASRSTRPSSPPSSASNAGSRTRSTRCRTAISLPKRCSSRR